MTDHTDTATEVVKSLRRGQRFTATQIGTLHGGRIISGRKLFTASRDHDVEFDFVPGHDGYPSQARVRIIRYYPKTFYRVAYELDAVELVIQDSIELLEADQ